MYSRQIPLTGGHHVRSLSRLALPCLVLPCAGWLVAWSLLTRLAYLSARLSSLLFCFPVYHRRTSPVPAPATRGSLCFAWPARSTQSSLSGSKEETPHRALGGRVFYKPLLPPSKPCRSSWLVIAATVTLPATQGSGEGTELGPTWCDSPPRRYPSSEGTKRKREDHETCYAFALVNRPGSFV